MFWHYVRAGAAPTFKFAAAPVLIFGGFLAIYSWGWWQEYALRTKGVASPAVVTRLDRRTTSGSRVVSTYLVQVSSRPPGAQGGAAERFLTQSASASGAGTRGRGARQGAR